jgi:isopenicillin-N N-acyltransferase-like protein
LAYFDDWNSPWPVCRSLRHNNRGNLVATMAMILLRPGEGHAPKQAE